MDSCRSFRSAGLSWDRYTLVRSVIGVFRWIPPRL
jgi:hypothetical protein